MNRIFAQVVLSPVLLVSLVPDMCERIWSQAPVQERHECARLTQNNYTEWIVTQFSPNVRLIFCSLLDRWRAIYSVRYSSFRYRLPPKYLCSTSDHQIHLSGYISTVFHCPKHILLSGKIRLRPNQLWTIYMFHLGKLNII